MVAGFREKVLSSGTFFKFPSYTPYKCATSRSATFISWREQALKALQRLSELWKVIWWVHGSPGHKILSLTLRMLHFNLENSYFLLGFWLNGEGRECKWVILKQKISLLKNLHVSAKNIHLQNNYARRIWKIETFGVVLSKAINF